MHGVARDFLVVELQQDRHGLERAPRQHQLAHAARIVRLEQPEALEPREREVEVAGLLAHEFQLVGRRVLGDDPAGAVEDQSAIGRQRLDARAVALRQLEVMLVLQHLQPESAPGQQQHERHDDAGGEHRALQEDPLLEGVVLDADPAHGGPRPSAAPRCANRGP